VYNAYPRDKIAALRFAAVFVSLIRRVSGEPCSFDSCATARQIVRDFAAGISPRAISIYPEAEEATAH